MHHHLNKIRQIISQNIKKYRLLVGLSKREVAQKSGVSYSHYCAIENGTARNPKLNTLSGITDALGIKHFLIWQDEKSG